MIKASQLVGRAVIDMEAAQRLGRMKEIIVQNNGERVAGFVDEILSNGWPQFVAIEEADVVGWCDIIPRRLEGFRHCARREPNSPISPEVVFPT